MTLDDLAIGQSARVVNVVALGESDYIAHRLDEIGFTLGESVAVLTRAVPGGDPLVVRVGQSRFALRRAEAQCVFVVVE